MKNKGLWLSLTVFIILAVIFAFTDWQISEALTNPESGWAHFMEAYGQLPGAFLGILSGSILLRTYKVEKNAKSIAGVVGLTLLTTFSAFGFTADAFGAQVDRSQLNLPAILGVTIAIVVIGQVILRRFSVEAVSRYKTAAKAGLALTFVAGFITVWAIKIPWGRWTYRDILEAGDLALFTPWYLPQGNNGHHSFISGHTALSFVVMGYLLYFERGSQIRKILLPVFLLWGFIGGLSRIVVGAHFPSDVLFGAGETLLWFWILQRKFLESDPSKGK